MGDWEKELREAESENRCRSEGDEYMEERRSGDEDLDGYNCSLSLRGKGEKSILKSFSLGMFFSRLLNHNARPL